VRAAIDAVAEADGQAALDQFLGGAADTDLVHGRAHDGGLLGQRSLGQHRHQPPLRDAEAETVFIGAGDQPADGRGRRRQLIRQVIGQRDVLGGPFGWNLSHR
jgi:hypothetical protein